MKTNEKGLPFLDSQMMKMIFENVYKPLGAQEKTIFENDHSKLFMEMLWSAQEYNYRFRWNETYNLFPLFNEAIGPFEINSEGTTLWLAMGLAIKEIYGMRRSTLRGLLKLLNG